MRWLRLSAILGLVVAASSPAQTPEIQKKVSELLAKERDKAKDKKPPTVEELLAQALRNNPDIRVAESKLREAEAELHRIQLQVTQKLLANQRETAVAKEMVEEAQAKLATVKLLLQRSAISKEEYRAVESALQKAKADLARIEAELPYLLGTRSLTFSLAFSPDGKMLAMGTSVSDMAFSPTTNSATGATDTVRLWDLASGKEVTSLPAAAADKIRQALDTRIQVDFDQVQPTEILDYLRDKVKGFNLVVGLYGEQRPKGSTKGAGELRPATLKLQEPVPVGAIFQFLEDQYGWRFVVREYGIVVTERDRVPPGAANLHDLWKNRPAAAGGGTAEKK
jgi:hypothetical protein